MHINKMQCALRLDQPARKPRMNTGLRIAILTFAAAGIVASVSGCGREQKAAGQGAPLPEVTTITVKAEETALSAELPGRVNALLVAEVRPQVGGIIQKRLFEEGSDVKEGDVLYQIDPALYQAAYDKALAELSKAEAAVLSIKKKYERYKILIKSAAVSQQDFDNAEADLKTAEAEIMSCKAAVETARINLQYTKITAPISGRIGKSMITVGALVASNHLLPLATIQQLDPIYVDVTQSTASYLQLKQAMMKGLINDENKRNPGAKLILENGSMYPLEGIQRFRDVTVDQSTGSFILRMVFPNPDKDLLPGMFVRAVIGTGINKHAILIPQQAVSRDSKGRPVALVAGEGDKVEIRVLTVGQSIDNKWLVTSGLKEGDRVIVEGIQRARPGAVVKVLSFNESKQAGTPKTAQSAK